MVLHNEEIDVRPPLAHPVEEAARREVERVPVPLSPRNCLLPSLLNRTGAGRR